MTEENTGNDPEKNVDPEQNNPNPAAGNDPEKNDQGQWIPKSRFDSLNEKKKQAEQTLEEIANEFVNDLPEDMKDIVPDLSPAEKIKWIKSAQKKGIFSQKAAESPDNETPAKGNKQVNTEGMSSFDMLNVGFKNQTKR